KGLASGDKIDQIGNSTDPYWVDLLAEVMFSGKNEALDLEFRAQPEGPEYKTTVVPRREENDLRPKIGILGADSLTLRSKRSFIKGRERPVRLNSPAAEADPPFEFGDKIIGSSDPDYPDEAWRPLPNDWRNTQSDQPDYFVFDRRNQRLAGEK